MSGDEQTIASLQQLLHAENQRRFGQIEEGQKQQQAVLLEILKNTANLPHFKESLDEVRQEVNKIKEANVTEIRKDVDRHEIEINGLKQARERFQGAMALFGVLGGVLYALWQAFKTFVLHK